MREKATGSERDGGHGIPAWVLPIAIIVVVAIVAFTERGLDEHEDSRLRAQTLLFSIEENAAELAVAEYEAIRKGELTPSVVGEVAENSRELERAVGELERLDPGDGELARVREELESYRALVDRELALIEAGRLDRARDLDEGRVDPGFEALTEVLDEAGARYEAQARSASVLVTVATYAAAVLAAVVLVVLARSWQREYARRSERDALRRSEERFRSLAQNASDAVTVIGEKGTILYESPSIKRLFGHEPEDRIGKDAFELVHPDDLGRVRGVFAEVMNTPGVITPPVEARVRHADGSWRHIEAIGNNLLDDPNVGGIVVNARDITERKRAQELIEQQADLLEQTHDAVFMWKLGGEIVYWNQGAERLYGWSREEALGRISHDLLKTSHPLPLDEFDRRLRREGHWEGELIHCARDGQRVVVESRHVLSRGGAESELVLETNTDITERKRTEGRLRRSEQRYRAVVEQAGEGIFLFDAETKRILETNPAFQRMIGHGPEELEQMTVYDVVPGDPKSVDHNVRRNLEQGHILAGERQYRRKDGTTLEVEASGSVISYGGKEVVCAVVRDITERKRAQELVKRQADLLEQSQRLARLGGWEWDVQTDEISWSDEVYRIYGLEPRSFVPSFERFLEVVHPDDRDRLRRTTDEALDGSGPYDVEHRVVRPDGEVRVVHRRAEVVREEGGEPLRMIGTVHDITERKEAEERLREAEAKYRTLTEQIPAVVYRQEIGQGDTISYVSPRIEEMMGYSAHEYVKEPGFWINTTHPDDRDQVLAEDARTETTGEPFRLEYRKVTRDGGVLWVRDEAVLVRDGSGQPLYWQGVMYDITERKRAEEEAKSSLSLLGATLESTADGILVTDDEGKIKKFNRRFADMWRVPEHVLNSGDDFRALEFAKHQFQDPEEVLASVQELYDHPDKESFEIVRLKDGRAFERYSVPQRALGEDCIVGRVWSFRDVTVRERVEQALRESEEKYRTLVEAVQEGIGFVDLEERITYCNQAYADVFEMSPQELVGRTLFEFMDEGQRRTLLEQTALRKDNVASSYELTVKTEGGKRKTLSATGTPIVNEGGELQGAVQTIIDITERKRAEEALRESEERYRAVIERTTDGVFLGDFATKRILESNAALQSMLGYSAEELRGKNLYEIIADDPESIDRNSQRILDGQSILIGERQYRRKDGSLINVETSGTVIPYGDTEASCCIARDVTERKRAEDAVREAEERYRTLVEQLPAITYIEAPDEGERQTNITYVSPQVERLLGYTVEEWLSDLDLWTGQLHPDDRERVLDEDARTEVTGAPFSEEYRLFARDGHVVWIHDRAVLVRDEEGRPRYWQGVMLDITGRKEAEEELRRSEERFRSLVQHSSDVITVLGADGTVRYGSPSVERVLGYAPEEMIGDSAFDYVHPEDAERVLDTFRSNLERPGVHSPLEMRIRHADGSWRSMETVANNLLDNPSVGGIVLNSRDITARKRAEEALRESHDILHGVTEGSTDVIFVKDRQGRYLMVNSACADLFGRPLEEMVGAHYGELFAPDEARRIGEDDRRIMATGQTETYEEGLKIGGCERTYLTTRGVHRDHAGEVAGTFGVARDITERKRAEEELRRSEARNRAMLEAYPDIVFRVSREGEFLDFQVNRDNELYVPRAEVIGSSVRDTLPPQVADGALRHLARTLQTGEMHIYEYRLPMPGEARDYEARFVAIDVDEALCVIRDITDRTRAEEMLRQQSAAMDSSIDGIGILDPDGVFTYVNEAHAKIYGYDRPEDFLGESWKKLYSDEQLAFMDRHALPALREVGHWRGEAVGKRRDGSAFPQEISLTATEGGGTVCVVRDIAERKLAQVELQRSLARLSALNEASRLLGSTLELEKIGSRLLETTRRVTALTAAAIFLQDKRGEVSVGHTLGPEDVLNAATSVPAAGAARRRALESGERQVFRLRSLDATGVPMTGLCVPLRVRDRTIGVLQAYGPENLSEEATMDTLTGLANQAAGALENARLYAELGDRENQLRELVGKLIMAQEEERRRVAREVHDGLTQMLVAAHQHLQTFSDYHPPEDPESRKDLEWVLGVVRQTVGEARRVIADLRPTALDDFGLATAIRLQAETLCDEGWEVTYEETLGEERLPVAMETALFRIAQEALTNVRKHAGNTRVRISLERPGGAVRLRIQDWGRGFSPDTATDSGANGERVGLSSMRERVALFGGSLEIESRPGGGTLVAVEVPLVRETILSDGA